MTKRSIRFEGQPGNNCVFVTGSCVFKRDTNVDVSGTVNTGAKNGKDDQHGTYQNTDGWINGNSNFVAVSEISTTWLAGSSKYQFEIDTSTAFKHEGLYVECRATKAG